MIDFLGVEGRQVAAPRRRRVHRRGAQDERRQVLEEDPARPLRRLRAAGLPRAGSASGLLFLSAAARISSPERCGTADHRRPALMTRWRNCCVRSFGRGAEDLRRVGPPRGSGRRGGSRRGRRSRGRTPISWVANSIVMPSPLEVADDVEHLADELGVERRRDLVEQHDLGVHRQRAGDRDALLLAARQLVGVGVGLVGETEPGRAAHRLPLARSSAGRPSTLRGAERDVVDARSCAGTG